MTDYDPFPDYQDDYDSTCPQCGHNPTRYRDCMNLFCQDGMIDEHEDDPINYDPGELVYACEQCYGSGTEEWCPACGADLGLIKMRAARHAEQKQ